MDSKTIEKIQARMEADGSYQDDLEAYDDIDNLQWALPSGWEAKEYVRKRVSTDGHDALKTAANIYDTHNPKWEILPRGLADKDAAEELETWLEWEMKRANQIGEGEPFRKAMHLSAKQNSVVYQVDYLPYWLPKDKKSWSKEQKAAMSQSSFCITVHNRRNIFFEMGKYGLKWAASVTNVPAQDVMDHWSAYEGKHSDEAKSISAAVRKIKNILDDDAEARFVHVDFTSHDKREVSVFPTSSESIEDFENWDSESKVEKIDILDCENELSFINWVVVTGDSDPMLYSMHHGGLWENQNLLDTLIDSTVLRRSFFPLLKHTSPTGKDLDVDYTGVQDVVELRSGEQAEVLQPPQLDPGLRELNAVNASKMGQASGVKGLASIEIAGNVQYAAVDAVIKLHMTSLTPYKRTVEKANAQLAKLFFMWVKEAQSTEIGYRTASKGQGREKGMQVKVGWEDFDPDELVITCELIPNTPNDKMQLVNMYSTLKQNGAQIAWGELLERLQLGVPEVLEQGWVDEQLKNAALQDFIAKIQAKTQLEVEAQQMQMQMEAQQAQMQQQQQAQAPQQGNPNQGQPVMPGGQMNNPAMQGTPPAMSAPEMTRTAMESMQ